MSIVRWDPWKEMEQLRAQTDRLWDAFLAKLTVKESAAQIGFLPDVDVVETAYDFRVFIAVPGLVEDDIEIEPTDTSLIVRGEREPPYDSSRQHVREWRYGFFERKLTFGAPIATEDVQAIYESGVLTVIMPKQESSVEDMRLKDKP